MPTEPQPLTLARAARRAVEACDPTGKDADLGRFLLSFEDSDEPISAVADLELRLAQALESIEPDERLPALAMAAAVVSYLARRRDEVGVEDGLLLSLAARAEFHGAPPQHVAAWLEQQGVTP